MPRLKLSKRAIDAVVPQSTTQFLWDIEKPGFGVKILPSGKCIFILQYRMGGRGTKTRRYTIGQLGAGWTVELAQREAGRLLLQIGQGVDPAAERQHKRIEAIDLVFEKVAARYLAEYVKPVTPKSYAFAERTLRLHVGKSFKGKSLPEIRDSDIAAMIAKIPVHSRALRRNVFAVTRGMYRWAKEEARLIRTNPFTEMRAPTGATSRDRVLDDADIKIVWHAMERLGPPFGAFAQCLLLLGQRRTEIAGMDWKELRRAHRDWEIPAARTKNAKPHIVPLGHFAVELLDGLAGGTEWPTHGPVFTTTGTTPIGGFSKAKLRIDEYVAEALAKEAQESTSEPRVMQPWSYHDLRRTMATTMQRLRVAPVVIEACENRMAGEARKGAAAVYQRYEYADEKRAAMEVWGEHLRRLLIEAPSNIVPLVA